MLNIIMIIISEATTAISGVGSIMVYFYQFFDFLSFRPSCGSGPSYEILREALLRKAAFPQCFKTPSGVECYIHHGKHRILNPLWGTPKSHVFAVWLMNTQQDLIHLKSIPTVLLPVEGFCNFNVMTSQAFGLFCKSTILFDTTNYTGLIKNQYSSCIQYYEPIERFLLNLDAVEFNNSKLVEHYFKERLSTLENLPNQTTKVMLLPDTKVYQK